MTMPKRMAKNNRSQTRHVEHHKCAGARVGLGLVKNASGCCVQEVSADSSLLGMLFPGDLIIECCGKAASDPKLVAKIMNEATVLTMLVETPPAFRNSIEVTLHGKSISIEQVTSGLRAGMARVVSVAIDVDELEMDLETGSGKCHVGDLIVAVEAQDGKSCAVPSLKEAAMALDSARGRFIAYVVRDDVAFMPSQICIDRHPTRHFAQCSTDDDEPSVQPGSPTDSAASTSSEDFSENAAAGMVAQPRARSVATGAAWEVRLKRVRSTVAARRVAFDGQQRV